MHSGLNYNKKTMTPIITFINLIQSKNNTGEDQKTKSTSPNFLMRTPCRIQEIFKEEFIVQKTRIRPRHHLHTLHQDHEQQQGVDQHHDVLHTRPQPADQYLYLSQIIKGILVDIKV